MADLTEKLAARLDDHIIENFADIYTMEEELARMEKGLDPRVIARELASLR